MERVQKRLLHLVAQAIELSIGNGKVEMSSLPYRISSTDSTFKATAQVRLDSSLTKNQAANVIRSELIRRFLAKPSGFLAGTRHSDNSDLTGSSGNNNIGTEAACQYITAYLAGAQQRLLQKFSKQTYKHLSYYHDASKVCTYEAHVEVL